MAYRELSMWPLPRKSRFCGPDKIREIYARFGVRRISEDRNAFEYGIEAGSGICELELTPEQYAKLLEEAEGRM